MSELAVYEVERLRQQALERVRAGELEDALQTYDAALCLADTEEARELITINKADAMIALGRAGAEVQVLPTIVMRRRNLHHVYLAAYALMFKYRKDNELKRATFYGQLALQTAEEANDAAWKVCALNELGVIYEIDSHFDEAINSFQQALELLGAIRDETQQSFSRVALLTNLAYNLLLVGKTHDGLSIMHSVIEKIEWSSAKADALIDLCYGYLNLDRYDEAKRHGEAALELAEDARQIRNAHYLLGEAAYKAGDIEAAEHHFDELAKFYPEFRNLKPLLYAIDLRSMVNLKL